jgi:hypothetical protein
MIQYLNVVRTFPSTRIDSVNGGLPVEVSLIAQLGHGSGNGLYESVLARQKQHANFVDELDEPSAKLGGTDFAKGDLTSLYSFVVGPAGHPFHRHAGHRIFTAITGSGGAQLRFATASDAQIGASAQAFVDSLRYINIPADCLFTVRFGGSTWHQFAPIYDNQWHPAFVAISCHTNELGGIESETLKKQVIENKASIPSLTEILPCSVLELLSSFRFQKLQIPTTTLSIDAPEGTLHRMMCTLVRGTSGLLRGAMARLSSPTGYVSQTGGKAP